MWLSTMPPVWLLSLLQQLHCHTAGLLLLLAVGDHGVCHHDPAWNGDSASKSKITAGLNTLCILSPELQYVFTVHAFSSIYCVVAVALVSYWKLLL